MLTEKQIAETANTISNGNKGHAEKLYIQDIILSTLSRETVDQLVFKGGTALLKFYQLDRFSEDLDFSQRTEIDYDRLEKKIVRDLENFGAKPEEIQIEENKKVFKARLGIQGPLFNGERRSLCFIRLEVNKKSSVEETSIQRYSPHFNDITSFELPLMTEEEIMAEKIRALMTRKQPRDLYDIYHLLHRETEIKMELVQSKLEYYNLEYDPGKIKAEAEKLEKSWGNLKTLVYSEPPEFKDVIEILADKIPEKTQ